jgi:hypothetical protein
MTTIYFTTHVIMLVCIIVIFAQSLGYFQNNSYETA